MQVSCLLADIRQPDGGQSPKVSTVRTRNREPDEICLAAVQTARQAAQELAGPAAVGAHQGAEAEDDRVVTHLFECTDRGYAGWRWAVTVARAPRAKAVTVSECVLLPGPGALLSPEWVPWRQRVQPGDLGPGDLLPASRDDERLVPAAVLGGDDGLIDWDDSPEWAAATAAPRVLSAEGRDAAARRWYSADHGPASPLASAAPGRCQTCGFLIPLRGPLGALFGVCGNEFAPDDGRVVSADHGCGAHSEAARQAEETGRPEPVVDEVGYDLVEVPGVALDETIFESLNPG
jgi:hypothetical protein